MIQTKIKAFDILLVEDNPGDIRLTREAFSQYKITNTLNVVTDGELAIKYLKKLGEYADVSTPDIILLDLNLPKIDGREVLKVIKTDAVLKRIPVVVLSTSESESDITSSYDNNANCYISKPIDFLRFIKLIKELQNFWGNIAKLPKRSEY